jgi:hypothetical protein
MYQLWANLEGPSGLEPDLSTAHGPTDGTENPQNHTDDHKNATDRVQDAEAWNEISDDEQNDSENYHDDSISVIEISGIQTDFAITTSVPVASAAHWATDGTEDPQDRTDNQQDYPDRLQHSHFEYISEYQQDDAQADHDASIPITWSMSVAGIELGCGRWQSVTFGFTPA